MTSSDKALLEFITRLAYNVEGLPGELKLYFSQFLTFHFSKRLSLNQIQDIENKRASTEFSNQEEIGLAAASFTMDEKIWAVASIQILQSQAEKIDNRVVSRKIKQLLSELLFRLKLEEETVRIAEARKRIEDEIHQFQYRPVVKISTSTWPLTFDYVLRWILLLSIVYFDFDNGDLAADRPRNLMTAFNVFFIPIFILITAYFVGRRNRKSNRLLLSGYGGEQNFKIEYKISTSQYSLLAFYLGSSVFISYLLPDQLHVLTLFGLIIYYFIYLRFFRVGKLKENELVKQIDHENLNTESLSVDENDEVIVALETKLYSSTSRLEAYVLESALFGALTFSGFLQIMATDLVSFTDLENFANYIFNTSQAFIHFDWPRFHEGINGLSNKTSLFCLVSVESLICSIFFLAVIASRLRFSDISDRIRTAINMAKAYNEKEESLHDEQEITGKKIARLEALTAKVNEQLHEANLVLEEIKPVMTYMEYFRNAGILVFVIILISSSWFITGTLGWIFMALVIATYLYFNRTTISNKLKALFLNFRIQFIRLGYWLFVLSIAPYVLAYIFKIFFHWQFSILFPLSAILVCLYTFIWLVLASHVDERFGEIEMDATRQKRWKFVKNTVAGFILIFGVASTMKMLYLMGANEMLMISLLSLSMLMYFVGYYLTKVRWLGILCGGVIAITCTGLCFKILHLDGANEMMVVGMIALIVLIPVILWKRKLFHQLFVRFCVAALLFSIWYNPYTYKIPLALEIAYANETLNIGKIVPVMESNFAHNFRSTDDAAIDKGIAQSDWYLKEYGTKLGFNGVHELLVRNYGGFADEILSDQESDTTMLRRALKAVRQEYKILEFFDFTAYADEAWRFGMEADILLRLGKKDKAIQSLEALLKKNLPSNVKEVLVKKLTMVKSQ